MKRTALTLLALVAILAAYLLLWPVPVEPVAWKSPEDRGLTGVFAVNDMMTPAILFDLGEHDGPEDAAAGPDRFIYATTHGGQIIRVAPNGSTVEVVADPGGRPLGVEFDKDGSLLVANAYKGVQRVSLNGNVETVFDSVDGKPLVYADDIAIADDGRIFVTEATTRFAAEAAGGTLEGSLLDIIEHGGNGLVIEYDPATESTRVIMDGLNFANGIAISDDQQYLLVAETGSYRILKHWLDGPEAGTTEVLIDNLPGFPDNINNGMNGRFWIGIVAPRNALLDRFSENPFMRKVLQRMPAFVRPKPEPSSHIFAVNGDGDVLMNLQDPSMRFTMTTGAVETRDALYITVLRGRHLPKLRKEDLL